MIERLRVRIPAGAAGEFLLQSPLCLLPQSDVPVLLLARSYVSVDVTTFRGHHWDELRDVTRYPQHSFPQPTPSAAQPVPRPKWSHIEGGRYAGGLLSDS